MRIGSYTSLRLKKEIKWLNAHGIFAHSSSFNIKIIQANDNKVFFIIKKKIGSAPTRNKIKRQLRAIIAQSKFDISMHIMFLVKPAFLLQSFQALTQEVTNSISDIIFKLSNLPKK